MSTARVPPTSDVGPVHDVQGSPSPEAGTRPAAMPPTTQPNRNGVATEDIAKSAPSTRAMARFGASLRNANAEPRATMPRPAKLSGTKKVVQTAANTAGNPVQRNTST